jgi:hypothetical protein
MQKDCCIIYPDEEIDLEELEEDRKTEDQIDESLINKKQ